MLSIALNVAYTVLVFFFVLGVLVFVHELGHFLAAKLVNIHVLRFSIGLGKPILAYRWGETEYALAPIPFGGYVKMAGDDPAGMLEGSDQDREDEKEEEEEQEQQEQQEPTDPRRHFDNKGMGQRFLVIFAGPAMNFVMAVLLFIGIFYFKGTETYGTTTVESINRELALPGMEQIRPGSRILSIGGREPAHWEDVLEICLEAERAVVEFGLLDPGTGERYTVSVSAPDDSTRQRLAYALNPLIEPRIGAVTPGKPASQAGIQPGDLFLEIEGQPIASWTDVTRIIHASPDVTLSILVDRGGQRIGLEVTPARESIPQADTFKTVGLVGISPIYVGGGNLSLSESVVTGTGRSIYTTLLITRSLWNFFARIVKREISVGEARGAVGGPVMIWQWVAEAARSNRLFELMAILSLNLAILNLLPIPVLDGGHLLFIFIEAVRFGRPLSPSQRMRMIQVGLFIVLALMILATANDIGRVIGI